MTCPVCFLHFGSTHFGGVADAVEVDVAFDPIGIGFFGADGVVFEADGVAHPVEQFFVGWLHHVPLIRFDFLWIPLYDEVT